MEPLDQDIERLIGRHLDGELSADERQALDRELLRNPGARRVMEQAQRIDEVAGAVLCDVLGRGTAPVDVQALPERVRTRAARARFRVWWLVPGAMAAALLGLFIARFELTQPLERSLVDGRAAAPILDVMSPVDHGRPPEDLMRTVGHSGRPLIERSTGRDVFGVVGEDGNIYWIEVDHIRTIRRPKLRSTGPL